MSHDRICTFNVSIVRINGNIILVGDPTVMSFDGMRFGARAWVFEECKGYVLACFRAHKFTRIRFRVQFSDLACRTIGFVLSMYPLYG